MSILTTEEFKKALVQEISSVQQELHIVSAFCKIAALKFVDDNIKTNVVSKKIIVRFLLGDIMQGATDFSLYEYCKSNGWELYIRFDLHAKTYIFDKQRYILGSNNLTAKGAGLNWFNNYELAAISNLEKADKTKIDTLFSSSILMTDEINELMKIDMQKMAKCGKNGKKNSWCKEIEKLFVPNLSVLFTYDFPQSNVSVEIDDKFEFLGNSVNDNKQDLREKFRWSKAFLWLYSTVSSKSTKEIYFGELSSCLHNALINDPKPYRKDVKDLLINLLGWVEFFDFDFIKIDKPNHSQRVTILEK